MPQNSEIVRAMYDAMARGDAPAALSIFDPQIVWREAENFIYADGNPYIGPQAILAGLFMRFATEWDQFAARPEQILEAGDTVISLGRYTGSYKKTGAGVNAQFVHVFAIRNGKIAAFQQYTDTAQFRDAAGHGASAKA
jgi:ketosteroid isomerase-like protein